MSADDDFYNEMMLTRHRLKFLSFLSKLVVLQDTRCINLHAMDLPKIGSIQSWCAQIYNTV